MTIGTRLYTMFNGVKVGQDQYGTEYYEAKKISSDSQRKKRWALYKDGSREPSVVPPEWHAWLHYTIDDVPPADGVEMYDWQKPHQPNKTGTSEAYYPKGHVFSGGERNKITSDYEAWDPNQ